MPDTRPSRHTTARGPRLQGQSPTSEHGARACGQRGGRHGFVEPAASLNRTRILPPRFRRKPGGGALVPRLRLARNQLHRCDRERVLVAAAARAPLTHRPASRPYLQYPQRGTENDRFLHLPGQTGWPLRCAARERGLTARARATRSAWRSLLPGTNHPPRSGAKSSWPCKRARSGPRARCSSRSSTRRSEEDDVATERAAMMLEPDTGS